VLIRAKRVGRDEYQCNSCSGATVKCKGCEVAMSRMGTYINDLYCTKYVSYSNYNLMGHVSYMQFCMREKKLLAT
jgi:hypothetical protein